VRCKGCFGTATPFGATCDTGGSAWPPHERHLCQTIRQQASCCMPGGWLWECQLTTMGVGLPCTRSAPGGVETPEHKRGDVGSCVVVWSARTSPSPPSRPPRGSAAIDCSCRPPLASPPCHPSPAERGSTASPSLQSNTTNTPGPHTQRAAAPPSSSSARASNTRVWWIRTLATPAVCLTRVRLSTAHVKQCGATESTSHEELWTRLPRPPRAGFKAEYWGALRQRCRWGPHGTSRPRSCGTGMPLVTQQGRWRPAGVVSPKADGPRGVWAAGHAPMSTGRSNSLVCRLTNQGVLWNAVHRRRHRW
jgi:hypothetical protein